MSPEEFTPPKFEMYQLYRPRAQISVLEDLCLFLGQNHVLIVRVLSLEFGHKVVRRSDSALKLAEGHLFGRSAKFGGRVATGLLSLQPQTLRPFLQYD